MQGARAEGLASPPLVLVPRWVWVAVQDSTNRKLVSEMGFEPYRGHPFKGTELVPGWCKRCGYAEFMHDHEAWQCRPETCGGIDYDPCGVVADMIDASSCCDGLRKAGVCYCDPEGFR